MDGWYLVQFPDDTDLYPLFVRDAEGVITWGWDEEDDPEIVPEGTLILLTTTEAATELGIQPGSVKRLCQREILKGEKRGRDWFISREEVDRYKRERHKPGRRKQED